MLLASIAVVRLVRYGLADDGQRSHWGSSFKGDVATYLLLSYTHYDGRALGAGRGAGVAAARVRLVRRAACAVGTLAVSELVRHGVRRRGPLRLGRLCLGRCLVFPAAQGDGVFSAATVHTGGTGTHRAAQGGGGFSGAALCAACHFASGLARRRPGGMQDGGRRRRARPPAGPPLPPA